MRRKYLRKIGGLFLATLMLSGIAFVAADTVEAQGRRRVVIVRTNPYRFHRPFGWGRRWHDPFGYDRWGYDPWSPYGSRYRHYVFDNSDKAMNQAYKDGFKTGKDDGKKAKSYNPQRSHFYKEAGFGNFAEVYRSGFMNGYQSGYRMGANDRSS
ncbi:MAG TPA: hypothetical protein VNO50_12060 [Pyrinomonadaceae bacterium]|nr:hypothetical protein [Pyrinomonadaceae bacterium]